ncbi:MAG: S-layer homology domain-containing protein [Candidatus Gracilibacteria bacterium]|nr:S-layer homology domain-containing protein [Candidatus Gracilibacteria bacterium]
MKKKFLTWILSMLVAFSMLVPTSSALFGFEFDLPEFSIPDMTEILFTDGEYTCPQTWEFDVSTDYFYQTDEILVTGGKAVTKTPHDAFLSAPAIVANKGLSYKTLSSFSDAWDSDEKFIGFKVGTVKYQLSPNATDWYYFNGTNWVTTSENSLSKANSATLINSNLASYNSQVGEGTLFFKAFLHSEIVPNLNPFAPTVYSKIRLDKVSVGCTQAATIPSFDFELMPDFDWGDFFEPAATETCDDGIQNQDETGIDCGGATCSACGGTACPEDATDLTWGCNNPPYTDASMCLDNGIANFLTAGCSDVAAKCCTSSSTTWNCRLTSNECQMPSGTDCTSGYTLESTTFGSICTKNTAATETCSDGIKNQDEEEIDCGGVCSVCPEEETDDESVFVDVPDTHDHAEAINYLESEGIVSGYDATHFGPDLVLKRGELLKIALNGAGIDTSSYLYAENPYSDLADNHTLKQYILYAYHNEIATGYGDGTFGPNNTATQAEAAKMLLNINDIDPSDAPAGVTYNLPASSDLIGFIHEGMEMNLFYDPSHYVATEDILRGYAAEIMYRILMVEDNSWSSFQD